VDTFVPLPQYPPLTVVVVMHAPAVQPDQEPWTGHGLVATQLVVVLGLVPHSEPALPVEPSEPTQS